MDKAVLTKKIIRNLARVNALKDGFKRDSENIRKNPLQSDIYKDSQVNALRDALSKALSASHGTGCAARSKMRLPSCAN